jgi:hypothetical protein
MSGRIKGLLGDNPLSRGINNLSDLLGINFAHDIFQREQSGMGTTPLERSLRASSRRRSDAGRYPKRVQFAGDAGRKAPAERRRE